MPLTSSDYLELWGRALAEPNGIAIGCTNIDVVYGLMLRNRPPAANGWTLTRPSSHPNELWVLPPDALTNEPGLPPNDPPRSRNDLDLADD